MSWIVQAVGNTAGALGGYVQNLEQERLYKQYAAQDEANARLTAQEGAITQDSALKNVRASMASLTASMAENGLYGPTYDRLATQSHKNALQNVADLTYQNQTQWAQYKNSANYNRYLAQQTANSRGLNLHMSLAGGAAQTLGSATQYYGWGGGKRPTANNKEAFNQAYNNTFSATSYGAGNKSLKAKLSL